MNARNYGKSPRGKTYGDIWPWILEELEVKVEGYEMQIATELQPKPQK